MPKTLPPLRELLEEYGDVPVCGRCLVVTNTTIAVRAIRDDRHGAAFASVEHPTDMLFLKAWVIEKILDRGWTFQIGSTTECFVPASTWHGDPVCAYHLYILADSERRGMR